LFNLRKVLKFGFASVISIPLYKLNVTKRKKALDKNIPINKYVLIETEAFNDKMPKNENTIAE
jgi:hypothetical protein